MPLFRYEAMDAAGRPLRGAMEAASEDVVTSRLRAMGLVPSAVAPSEVAQVQTPSRSARAAPARPQTSNYVTSSLPISDQALFWRQLAELAAAGIAPFDMFQSLGSRTRNRRIRRAALDVARRIGSGSSVADAMAENHDVFGTDYRVAVMAGELGGFVHEVYGDLARALDEEKQHRERWRWFRWYNNANLVGTLIVVHFLLVVGSYINVHTKGLEPLSDRWYEVLKDSVRAWPPIFATRVLPVAAGAYLLYVLLMRWLEYGGGRPIADSLVLSLPLIGRFKRLSLLARFYRMLRRLLSGGVSPIVAWDAAADATGNHRISRQLAVGRGALMTGGGFGAALQRTGIVPDGDTQMMATADRSGRVPEMLVRLETDYEARYQSASRLVRMAALLPAAIAAGAITVLAVYMIATGYFKFIFDYTGN